MSESNIIKALYSSTGDEDTQKALTAELLPGSTASQLQDFLGRLTAANSGSVCGKVFEHREHAYICRTCGADPTCIQCMDCFKDADHTGHDVRMAHTGGGGCCDCGDSESWDPSGFCSKHEGLSDKTCDQICSDIAEEDCGAVRTVVEIVIRLIFKSFGEEDSCIMLMDESFDMFKESLSKQEARNNLVSTLVLLNDDVNTFQSAMAEAQRAVPQLSEESAQAIALRIDNLDSCVIACSYDSSLIDSMERNMSSHFERIVGNEQNAFVVSHSMILRLVRWLVSMCKEYTVFKAVVIQSLLKDDTIGTWTTAMHAFSRPLWEELNNLLFQLLMVPEFKFIAVESILSRYEYLLNQSAHLLHVSPSSSMLSYAVQLFTIPAVVAKMLPLMLDAFTNTLQQILADSPETPVSTECFEVISHFQYALRTQGAMQVLLESHPDYFMVWVSLLGDVDKTDPQVRVLGQHVLYESEVWQPAFIATSLVSSVSNTMAFLLQVHLQDNATAQATQDVLIHLLKRILHVVRLTDVDSTISFHYPQCRFIGRLVTILSSTGVDISSVFDGVGYTMDKLAHPIYVLSRSIAQMRSGLWVRNGLCVMSEVLNYFSTQNFDTFYGSDLLMIQLACIYGDGKAVFNKLLLMYSLQGWFRCGDSRDIPFEQDKVATVAETFLELVLHLLLSRSYFVLDPIDYASVRVEVVQHVSKGKLSHSEVVENMGIDTDHEKGDHGILDAIEAALRECCDYQAPRGAGEGKFSLKTSFLSQFDIGFPKWKDSDLQQAVETYGERTNDALKRGELKQHDALFPPVAQVPPFPRYTSSIYATVTSPNLGTIWCTVFGSPAHSSQKAIVFSLRLMTVIIDELRQGRIPDVYHASIHDNFRASDLEGVCLLDHLIDFVQKHYAVFDRSSLLSEDAMQANVVIWILTQLSSLFDDVESYIGDRVNAVTRAKHQHINPIRRFKKRDRVIRKIQREMKRKQRLFMLKNAEFFQKELGDVKEMEVEEEKTLYETECIICRDSTRLESVGLLARITPYDPFQATALDPSRRCLKEKCTPTNLIEFCGHAVHFSCYRECRLVLIRQQGTNEYFNGRNAIDPSAGEILCPFCKNLCNTLVPQFTPPRSQVSSPRLDAIRNTLACQEETEASDRLSLVSPFLGCALISNSFIDVCFLLSNAIHQAEFTCRFRSAEPLFHQIERRDLDRLRSLVLSVCGTLTRCCLNPDSVNGGTKECLEFDAVMGIYQDPFFALLCKICSLIMDRNLQQTEASVSYADAINWVSIATQWQEHLIEKANDCAASRHQSTEEQYTVALGPFDPKRDYMTPFLRKTALLWASVFYIDLSTLRNSAPQKWFRGIVPTVMKPPASTKNLSFELQLGAKPLRIYPMHRVGLVRPPREFNTLFQEAHSEKCHICGIVPKALALCLLCGKFICLGKAHSRTGRQGNLCTHSLNTRDQTGIFLDIRRSCIFLLYSGRVTQYQSPYLDEHGEEDFGLRRGKPLFLDESRFETLNKLWYEHQIGREVTLRLCYNRAAPTRFSV